MRRVVGSADPDPEFSNIQGAPSFTGRVARTGQRPKALASRQGRGPACVTARLAPRPLPAQTPPQGRRCG